MMTSAKRAIFLFRSFRTISTGCTLVAALAMAWPRSHAAEGDLDLRTSIADPSSVEGLVEKALGQEILGMNGERQRLLAEALKRDSGFAPARWQTGHVRLDGTWVKIEDVPDLVRDDPRRQEYRRLRGQKDDSIQDQLELGNWCDDHRLREEARGHFLRVLEKEPDNFDARTRLGFRRAGSVWMTEDEIQQVRDRRKELHRAFSTWQPRLQSIRERLESPVAELRKAAKEELLAIDDPLAVAVLERHLAPTSERAGQLVAENLGKMPGEQATLALTRLAVLSPSYPVRLAAAEQLKAQPLAIFVPPLLATMSTPVDCQTEFHRIGGGRILIRRTMKREGQAAKERGVHDTVVWSAVLAAAELTGGAGFHVLIGGPDIRGPSELAWRLNENTASWDLFLAQRNTGIDAFNRRIASALNVATTQDLPPDPNIWWQWWNDRNEVTLPDKRTRGVFYDQTRLFVLSCFAKGTPVRTITGPRPIETIQTGDLVLAQDVESGELAYKPVIRATVRPEVELIQVRLDGETLHCTGGHPFWVCGTGWVHARRLLPGCELHGLNGTKRVHRVKAGEKLRTHNLVVADFGTYFVGDEMTLVHDTSLPKYTDVWVPGLK